MESLKNRQSQNADFAPDLHKKSQKVTPFSHASNPIAKQRMGWKIDSKKEP